MQWFYADISAHFISFSSAHVHLRQKFGAKFPQDCSR